MMPFGVSLKFARTSVGDLLVGNLAGAEGLDQNADRLGNANGVRKLNFATVGKPGRDDVLGDVARHVAGGTINLGRILAARTRRRRDGPCRRRCPR